MNKSEKDVKVKKHETDEWKERAAKKRKLSCSWGHEREREREALNVSLIKPLMLELIVSNPNRGDSQRS